MAFSVCIDSFNCCERREREREKKKHLIEHPDTDLTARRQSASSYTLFGIKIKAFRRHLDNLCCMLLKSSIFIDYESERRKQNVKRTKLTIVKRCKKKKKSCSIVSSLVQFKKLFITVTKVSKSESIFIYIYIFPSF